MLIQAKITLQLSVDSPSNVAALTFGLNIRLRSLTHQQQWHYMSRSECVCVYAKTPTSVIIEELKQSPTLRCRHTHSSPLNP